MTTGWGDLPAEILLMIMSNLKAKELARLCDVSYHWRRVAQDDQLWKHLFITDFKQSERVTIEDDTRWIDEYKMLKFETPVMLTENFQDCRDGLRHVTFSNNGHLFCTVGNDSTFKVWTATSPIYLLDERCMSHVLDWDDTLYSQFSPDDQRLMVAGKKGDCGGEIAIYTIDEANMVVHYTCRVSNNPPGVGACWYNLSYIISGDIFTFDTKVVGSSVSQIWICSAMAPSDVPSESVMCTLLRLLNRGGSFSQMIKVGRFVPPRLRGILLLAEEAVLEHKTLISKANELLADTDLSGEDERREHLRQRIDALSGDAQCCIRCTACPATSFEPVGCWSTVAGSDHCECECHQTDHRLLVYAVGERPDVPPHQIAFKIIDGDLVLEKLFPCASAQSTSEQSKRYSTQRVADDRGDQLSSLLAMVDLADHVMELNAHIMDFTLSANHRYLFVNVTHDHYSETSHYSYLAEVRVINLSTMSFEASYFGHFATIADHLYCSPGRQYLASASLDGGRVWSGKYRCVLGELPHIGGATAVALSPTDSSIAVSVGRVDGRIKIWRSKKWQQINASQQRSFSNYRDFDVYDSE